MANPSRSKGKPHRNNQHRANQWRGGSASRKGAPVSTRNPYESIANTGDTGELNTDLVERFGAHYSYPDSEVVPMSAPPRLNDDIKKYFDDVRKPINAGAWATKPEFPTPEEIMPDRAGFPVGETIIDIDVADTLQPNKVIGAYDTNEDYLRTQYELLRQDAIRPLQGAIEQVRSDPWRDESEYDTSSGIGIYEPVYLTSIVFSPRGLAVRIAFSLSRVKKYIRWEQSKRLTTGSLVALSPFDDAFQTKTKCILAVVAARPVSALAQNPPEIDLFFARPQDMEIDPMKKWIMVESRSSFFEASRHTLLALQHLMREPFPMSKHLVKVSTVQAIAPPAYVQNSPYTDMSSLVAIEESEKFQNVNILEQWPSNTSLDNSQSKALKTMLTNDLAIVQGPPGTGKTHVSVVALKVRLANMRRGDPPIIVTCQTNHALDQLLRHVAEFEPNFIRLGGRSKDKDKIKKRTLYEVRLGFSQEKPKTPGSSLKSRSMGKLRELSTKMALLLKPLELGQSALSHTALVKIGVISPEQAESLEMGLVMGIEGKEDPGIYMEQWLGLCMAPCRRPILPDDFGAEFEEEDFELEQLKELEAEAAQDDDDIEALKGQVVSLSDNTMGKGSSLTDHDVREILSVTDLTTIPLHHRGAVYNYFKRQMKQHILVEFRKLAQLYAYAVEMRKIGQWEEDQTLLQTQRLIGMTTTGVSKYRPLLASLRPQIVLVEEAAETLEAPVTAACLPTVEHLILVGDHQQLRPRCQVRQLEDEPYNLNLSLFERMVHNEVDFTTLQRQRRMIPEIRGLLDPIYGNGLKDHPSVKDPSSRPAVHGMGDNSYFFTHEWPESYDANMSCLNEKEADMIVGVVDYLVLNDVDPTKITILTFYNGQRKLLTKKLRLHPNLRGAAFHVVTVDSYQGEENDIVLLSLVRSNRKHNIGFLSVDNRVCVALSRAKRGFYLFGNAELLACESAIWSEVVTIMCDKGPPKTKVDRRRIGYYFPLVCSNHGNRTWIEDPDDWPYINGGCFETCRCHLPCGHTCMLKCHPFDNGRINCTQKCSKRLEICGHPCVAMCCDPCRCQICERYNDGVKSLVKPSAMGNSDRLFRTSLTDRANNTSFHGGWPSSTPGEEFLSERSGNMPDEWYAFANGGARADDARIYQKAREEAIKFGEMVAQPGPPTEKLVEVSPKNSEPSQASKKAELLVDLAAADFSSQGPFGYRFKGEFSYAASASGANTKQGVDHSSMSLLD